MRLRHGTAVALFAARSNFRSTISRVGAVAVVAIAALGTFGQWTAGRGLTLDPDFLFLAYLTGALFILRSGLEQQRECDLVTFLRHNLTRPTDHAVGMVLSLLTSWVALTMLIFLLTLSLSLGDLASAAWFAASFALPAAMLLPFALLVESVSGFRLPFLLPVLGYIVLAAVLTLTLGEERMVSLLRFDVDRGDPGSMLRLAARATTVLVVGMGAYLATVSVRHRDR